MSEERLESALRDLGRRYRQGEVDGLRITDDLRQSVRRAAALPPAAPQGPVRRGSVWWVGAAAFAAGLIALAIFTHWSPAHPTAPARHHVKGHRKPPTVSAPGSPLDRIDMVSASIGWATTQDNHVLRTTDGGTTWTDVTPKGFPSVPHALVSFTSLGGSDAWLAVGSDGNTPVAVYRTKDGGATWQSAATRLAVASSIRFVNPETGFLLLFEGAAAGSEGVLLLRTADGGATWSVAADGRPTAQQQIIFGGDKNGFGLSDAQHIWLTGEWAASSILLYATADGGATWSHASPPAPPGVSVAGGAGSSEPPQFFGTRTGVLPVEIYDGQTISVFEQTTDGGRTWTPTTPVTANVYAVVDPSHIVASDGSSIDATSDGGLHWRTIRPNVSLKGLTRLDFVSPTKGWAIVGGRLLETADGGATWSAANAQGKSH